jgi:hypothetical protein
MAADDDLIRAYDEELGPEPVPRSNRGFWVVAGTLLVGCVFLIVEIFANRSLGNAIGHAQDSLTRAQEAAEIVYSRTASYEEADAASLEDDVPDLSFRPGDDASFGLDVVSVSAAELEWAAAVQTRPGACFYIHLHVGQEARYGAGTKCTGQAALLANDPRW